MPTNYPINPDTPLPISMLPEVDELEGSDLLLVTQPGAELGRRSKSLKVSTLLGGPLARFAHPVIKSNILAFSGTLPDTKMQEYKEVCHLDIDPRLDVEFHVFGTSGSARPSGTTGAYDYGLRAKTRMFYTPDDQDRELVTACGEGSLRILSGSTTSGPDVPTYNAIFGCTPHNYVVTPAVLANYPTKRVTLFLSGGSSANPTQATGPASYSLKIQAIIYPARTEDVLQATEAT